MTLPRDLVDVAADAVGDLVVTAVGDLALAGGDDAILPNVREAVTCDFYRMVGAPFFGHYLWLFINHAQSKLERAKLGGAIRYPLLYNELVDPTSIRARWPEEAAGAGVDDEAPEVKFATVASSAPRRLKFARP